MTKPKPDQPYRVTVAGYEDWLKSEAGQRFAAMTEAKRNAYASELCVDPRSNQVCGFLAEMIEAVASRPRSTTD